MKILYIADDGKEFNNENDCVEYENSYSINNLNIDDVMCWNKDFEPLKITLNNLVSVLGKGYFIKIKSEDALNIVNKIMSDEGYNITDPEVNVCYRWDDSTCLWRNYNKELMEEYKEIVSKINKLWHESR